MQTHEEEARSGLLEMEWERWLRGEETRSAGGHEPAGRVWRGPGMELGGLLMSGKGPEGAQEKELRRARGGNLRLWGQASLGLKGGRTAFAAPESPLRQPGLPPWPPPLRWAQGRRGKDDSGNGRIGVGERQRLSEGTTMEGRGSEERTPRAC